MPSFGPKLESTIKVMRHRMAKNDQKFTKICFSWELSLKSGKINFREFWIIFGLSRVHHLKKTPKNGMDLRKNPISRFFVKNTGFLAFLVPYLQEKFIKMKKFFFWIFFKVQRPKICKITVISLLLAQSSQIPQKKKRFSVFHNDVRILAESKKFPKGIQMESHPLEMPHPLKKFGN